MTRKNDGFGFPPPEKFMGAIYTLPVPPEQKILYGFGALMLGLATIRFAPKMAKTLIPILAAAFTPAPGQFPKMSYHPEGMEPIKTIIDERQLWRSEVIREIAKPKRN